MKNKLIAGLAGIVGLAIFAGLNFAQTVYAANFTVTKTADTNDGVCDSDCSLREAIGAANASAGADTITVPSGTYALSIAGTGEDANATGDLDITDDLTINGAGNTSTIIDGGAIDRVIEVRPGATVSIDAVTIRNGNSSGILNRGTLTLTNSTVTNNSISSFGGGGLFNTLTGTMTVIDSTVSNNTATSPDPSHGGGGIYSDGTVTLNRITVSGNTTTGRGGGIYNQDPTTTIVNSTISGNTALNGGGIFNRFGMVNLTHSTITGNTATDNGGGIWNFGGTMTLKNTIVSTNTAATAADDCSGGKTSLGYNLAGDASCAFGGTGDLNSTNPLLGPLAQNGGPTQTHALLLGSPAIDVVPLASCTVSTDQRGVPRPQGAACDIGAFEGPPTLPQECHGDIDDYNIIQGTVGNDTLAGTSSKDLIFAYGGNDRLTGGAGDDCLAGGDGNDRLMGGSGDDVLIGNNGNDNLRGGSGDDDVFGGMGNDKLNGDSGNDELTGNEGNDEANGATGSDTCDAETETSCEF